MLCNFCLTREKNAGIIHGRITHQICCYQCAKKLVKQVIISLINTVIFCILNLILISNMKFFCYEPLFI